MLENRATSGAEPLPLAKVADAVVVLCAADEYMAGAVDEVDGDERRDLGISSAASPSPPHPQLGTTMAPHKTRIVTLDSPDLESGATQPDPSNSEESPLLPAATPHHHHHRSTPRVKESFSQRWWVGVLGGGLAVTVLVAGGILISRKASSPSDTPDFSKLPPPQPGGRNPSYLSSGWGGAVASEVDVCSEIGIEVLRDGGTATDAGIAVTLCIGTTNMFSSGIGG